MLKARKNHRQTVRWQESMLKSACSESLRMPHSAERWPAKLTPASVSLCEDYEVGKLVSSFG